MKWRSRFLIGWVFFCFLTGCATQRPKKDLIVLLPDPDGKGGAITVTTDAGSQIIDKPGYGTEIEHSKKAPSAPRPIHESEIKEAFGPALSAQPDLSNRFLLFILYFEYDTTKLIPGSKTLLSEVLKNIHRRKSNQIYIVGHTDLVGTEAYNIDLSSKRARLVRDWLVSKGITPGALHISYYGKSRPLVATQNEVPEPRNRRVEVIVR